MYIVHVLHIFSNNYQEDSLRRLNHIDLIINNHTFSKLFSYDDNNVDSSMGNATSRISKITYKTNDSTHRIHEFTYDENHNIIHKLVKSPSLTIETYDYYYDGFNQLIREDISIYNQMAKTITYSYDTQGNITTIKAFAYKNVSGTPVKEKRMFYQNVWKDQLTKIEYYEYGTFKHSETYSYDASGNVTNIFDSRAYYYNKSMQWEGRQLKNFTSYCESNTYTYNDMGIRTSKKLNSCGGSLTTTYTLDGDKVLIEERSDGTTLYFTYDVDGTLLSMNYNGNEYFYITNLQGDIIELVDISGNIVATYNYDAWGNIISKFGALSDINPYRYRGYRWDEESGYYYLNSRYYNPQTGRFINSDGLLGPKGNTLGHNVYAYSFNNPVMYTDYSGMIPELNKMLRSLFISPVAEMVVDLILTSIVLSANKDDLVAMVGVTISASGGQLTKNMGVSFSIQRVCNASNCEYQFVFGSGWHSTGHIDGGIYIGLAEVKSFEDMYGSGLTGGASYAKGKYGALAELDYYLDSTAEWPLGINVGYAVGNTLGPNLKIEYTYTTRIGGIFSD